MSASKPNSLKKTPHFLLIVIAFCSISTCYAIKPDSVYKHLPSDFDIAYNEVTVTTSDGYSVNTWIFEPAFPDSTTQTILIAGADAGNMAAYIPFAGYLADDGFRVVTFDYRGFGESSPFEIDSLTYYYNAFEEDLKAVIKYISGTYRTKVSILAFSYGSLVTLQVLAGENMPVDKVIFDGLVADPESLISRVAHYKGKVLKPYTFKSLDGVSSTIPFLVFSGTEDQYTTTGDAMDFQKKFHKTVIILYNGGHMKSVNVLQTSYFKHIKSFMSG